MFLISMISAARKIHRDMAINILYAPLNEFFDRVPIGRIINRFSKDLVNIDERIGFTLNSFFVCFFFFLGDLLICVYTTTIYMLGAVVLFAFGAIYVQKLYMNVNREAVRLGIIYYL